ncbi:uncharacterized protein LOC131696164, partial [Topomyia yanbarensis]|uniref:uncharacterized protein LOC131696164 n=1 Tax=Topomyia yanbarensis TaxID=2498891 RepID=UPI00273C98FE
SKLNVSDWIIPDGVLLADPNFYRPQRIDLLIGAQLFFHILRTGQIQLGDKLPVLQETTLGWVVSGAVTGRSPYRQYKGCHKALSDPDHQLEQLIQRFWELEEIPLSTKLSSEEELCEQHYQQTTTRDISGRYVVRLPFRNTPDKLGDSRQQALQRFGHLERRLATNSKLKEQYDFFMEEYIRLNHCKETPESEVSSSPNFYLPHHAILKPTSSSTKLRTVFDASAKSSSGVSLNDLLMIGPAVQDSLLNIVMRFRIHRYVFSKNHLAKASYGFTVTYGTASAPFAATRTLNQLAANEGFPLAAAIVVKDFYVDDVLSGGDSVNEIQTAAEQLTQLLDSGGFQLHKWCSNSAEFLESIPDELREKQSTLEMSGANDVIKTLGLLWNPSSYELAFRINPIQAQTAITKRHILSEMSKIYDPLGLLAPATLVSKLLMRELWKLKIDWDEEVPIEQRNNWVNFITSLIATAGMTINRYVLTDNRIAIELHAYSDASLAAYGTCVYIRSICSNGNAEVHLLTSKSKVAPNQTIPRLELCAFLLMSRLVKVVTSALKLDFNNIVLWTDSQIVLCWLKKSPHELNTFVANRVAKIQRSTKGYEFKYIRSALNPADMVSRGVLPGELMHNDVWWHDPSFSRTATYKEFVFTEEI